MLFRLTSEGYIPEGVEFDHSSAFIMAGVLRMEVKSCGRMASIEGSAARGIWYY